MSVTQAKMKIKTNLKSNEIENLVSLETTFVQRSEIIPANHIWVSVVYCAMFVYVIMSNKRLVMEEVWIERFRQK